MTPSPAQPIPAAGGTAIRSPYENRVKLVQDTLTACSVLDHEAAGKLAVQVLHALDSIPEKVR
jgi:Family of unknown function (DUF6307)